LSASVLASIALPESDELSYNEIMEGRLRDPVYQGLA